MRYVIPGCFLALCLAASAGAQDTKIKTETKVKADNGKVVTMTGCMMLGGGTSLMLSNPASDHDNHDKRASAGPLAVIGRDGLDLGAFVNQKVELTGVIVPAATKGDSDDKIKIEETTKVKVDGAPDRKASGTTTTKVDRGITSQFVVASVKTVAPGCSE